MIVGVDRCISKTTQIPVDSCCRGFGFQEWLDHIRGILNNDNIHGVVLWPTQRNRGRVYVHLLDRNRSFIAFAKISFDELNHQSLLRETEAIRQLTDEGLGICHIPNILASGQFQESSYLITEPIPDSARPLRRGENRYPSHWVRDFAGPEHNITLSEMQSLSWWKNCAESLNDLAPNLLDNLDESLAEGVNICRIHGDFTSANILIDGEQPWIFDWEASCADGPSLTDEIGFYLALHSPHSKRQQARFLRQFQSVFLRTGQKDRRANVMLSLAHQHMAGITMASNVLTHWSELGD
jgi:hypothetical protein